MAFGLEMVLPAAAKRMGSKYHFLVIGGGGASSKLINSIKSNNVNNIEILPPVKREKLIKYYKDADILFLHLNDIPAFRRVLLCTIFEYTALTRLIVVGLGGYSAKFIVDNVPYATIFNSEDVDGCVDAIKNGDNTPIPVDEIFEVARATIDVAQISRSQ